MAEGRLERKGLRMKIIALLSFFLLFAPHSISANSKGDDWKLYGSATLDGNDEVTVFYSSSSIQKLQNGHIRVWVKSLAHAQINQTLNAKRGKDARVERVAKKMVDGLSTPIAKIESLTSDQIAGILLEEEVANEALLVPRAQVFYELNCATRQIKGLSLNFVDKAGKRGSTSKEGEWDYVPPESIANRLMKMLCD